MLMGGILCPIGPPLKGTRVAVHLPPQEREESGGPGREGAEEEGEAASGEGEEGAEGEAGAREEGAEGEGEEGERDEEEIQSEWCWPGRAGR